MRLWEGTKRWVTASFLVGAMAIAGSISLARLAQHKLTSSADPGRPFQSASLRMPILPRHPSLWSRALVGYRRELTYENLDGYKGTLYLFLPSSLVGGGRSPLVVYFHGGALEKGSAVIHNPQSPHEWIISSVEANLIRQGYAFATVNYRLAPKYKWPAQIDDAKTALRFLRTHADRFHLNTQQIGVMGDSAGGALASLVGLSGNGGAFDGGPWPGQSTAVSAVVDMFGPVDRRFLAHVWLQKHGVRPHPVFGKLTSTVVHTASAVSYVHPEAPPFLIIQGTRDTIVPPWLSVELYDKLQAEGDPVKLLWVKHSEHEFIADGGPIRPSKLSIAQDITSFLTGVLGNHWLGYRAAKQV